MIRRMRIAGFKRFDETGIALQLAPITLLLGGNSTGKSSVFQALLCLERSWERPTGFAELAAAGQRVDLGRFGGVLHRSGGKMVDPMRIEIDGVTFTWEDADVTASEDQSVRSSTRHRTLTKDMISKSSLNPCLWHTTVSSFLTQLWVVQ